MRNKAETKIFRENRAEAIAVRKAKLQVSCYAVCREKLHDMLLKMKYAACLQQQYTLFQMCSGCVGHLDFVHA